MTKVLVAEDERHIRELLVDILTDLGFDVLESVNGGEAYEKAYQEGPDLILLDIMMPVMDGFEVLAKLRRNPETAAIPIIILTSVSAAEREQDAYNSGVNHYISKPFDAETLESTIRVALRESRIEAGQDPGLDESGEASGEASGEGAGEGAGEGSGESSGESSGEGSGEGSGESSSEGSGGSSSEGSVVNFEGTLNVLGGSVSFSSPSDVIDTEADAVQPTGYIQLGESLTTLGKILGGGIRLGTVTLMVGSSGTGKSVLCQTIVSGAIEHGHGVAYFTSQLTPAQMATQMTSIGLELSEEDQTNQFGVYPLPEPVFGEDSGTLLKDLAVDLAQIPSKYGLIVVDAITDLASTSQDYAIMAFFSNCKRMCLNGRTLVVVAHASAFSADLLSRASSVCETFMKLSTGKLRDRPVRKAELLKVDDIELDRENTIAFDVQPELGLQIIPFGQVKA